MQKRVKRFSFGRAVNFFMVEAGDFPFPFPVRADVESAA
jgi:hypothetical protein